MSSRPFALALAAMIAAATPAAVSAQGASHGQVPGADTAAAIPMSHHDRVYAAEQFSNTVSVTDPVDNALLGVIRLGDPQPSKLSPRYRGPPLWHGRGSSPAHRTPAVVSPGRPRGARAGSAADSGPPRA